MTVSFFQQMFYAALIIRLDSNGVQPPFSVTRTMRSVMEASQSRRSLYIRGGLG